jgi:hypothetical protein
MTCFEVSLHEDWSEFPYGGTVSSCPSERPVLSSPCEKIGLSSRCDEPVRGVPAMASQTELGERGPMSAPVLLLVDLCRT